VVADSLYLSLPYLFLPCSLRQGLGIPPSTASTAATATKHAGTGWWSNRGRRRPSTHSEMSLLGTGTCSASTWISPLSSSPTLVSRMTALPWLLIPCTYLSPTSSSHVLCDRDLVFLRARLQRRQLRPSTQAPGGGRIEGGHAPVLQQLYHRGFSGCRWRREAGARCSCPRRRSGSSA
jgi:hypothetical protein